MAVAGAGLLVLGVSLTLSVKFGVKQENRAVSVSQARIDNSGQFESSESANEFTPKNESRDTSRGHSLIENAATVEVYLERLKNGAAYDPVKLNLLFETQTTETDSKTRLKLLAMIARELMSVNPDWAVDLIGEMPEFHDRLYFSQFALRFLKDQKPEMAIAWIGKLPAPSLSANLYRSVGNSWAQSDLRGAVSWAEANRSHPRAADFVDGLSSAWSQQNPSGLIDWVEETGQSGNRKGIGGAKMAKMTSMGDPRGAMEMALALPASAESTSAILYNLATWTRTDLDGAVRWVDKLDDRGLQSLSRLGVINTLMQSDYDSAVEWIDSWPDREAAKPLAYQKLVDYWKKKDPARLDRLLETGLGPSSP